MRTPSVLVALSLACSAASAHPPYRLDDLGDFLGGDASGGAYGVNGLGEAVGGADDSVGRQAFILRNGKLVRLPTPNLPHAVLSEAFVVNQHGVVAGNVYSASYHSTAVIWDEQGYRELGTLGGAESSVLDINAAGAVVGYADTPSERSTFLWLPDASHGFPAGMSELQGFLARNINDRFQIAAQYRGNAGRFHTGIWLPEPAFDLPAGFSQLPAQIFPEGTLPQGMNNRGAIVGGGRPDPNSEHPALWLPESMYGLDAGWHDLGLQKRDRTAFAWDLNDRGWVVGTRTWYGDPPSEFEDPPIFIQGFLWIPGQGSVDLDDLIPPQTGYSIVYPRGINNRGQIAASAASAQHLAYRAVLLTPLCPADWNGDARVDSADFFDFITEFFSNEADFNADAITSSQDFFDFLGAFFDPC